MERTKENRRTNETKRRIASMSAAESPVEASAEKQAVKIRVKWKKAQFEVELLDGTVGDLKEELFSCTGVLPARQKLLNLKKG